MSPNGEWDIRIVLITSNIVSLGFLTMIEFGNIKGNFLIVAIITMGYAVTYITSHDKVPNEDKLRFIVFYGSQVFIGFCICFIIIKRMFNKLLEIINLKLEAQSIFKHIFDNSEESIIIVKDQQVEYVNNYFLEKFKKEITSSIEA